MDPNLKELNDSEVTNLQNSGPAVTSADRTEIKTTTTTTTITTITNSSAWCVCVCLCLWPLKRLNKKKMKTQNKINHVTDWYRQ